MHPWPRPCAEGSARERTGWSWPPFRSTIEPSMPNAEPHTLSIPEAGTVSGLWTRPAGARACYVMAHGAGAGMRHPFMEAVSEKLAGQEIATLRFQFPFMEAGSRRVDRPDVAHATVRAAVDAAAQLAPDLPLLAGGRSFGGRMTSQAQALAALPGLRGLVFLGFPLHPAGRPSGDRGRHLGELTIPMLFVQGARDALATPEHLLPLCEELRGQAMLRLIPDADHAFHVPARSGRRDADVQDEIATAMSEWIGTVV